MARQADPYADEDYEYRRGVNEHAVLSLSHTTDPRELFSIYSHLGEMLSEVRTTMKPSYTGEILIASDETCMRMAILFTYYKAVAQRVSLVRGDLEKLYKFQFNFRRSSGGLIYELYPAAASASDTLPGARAKVPVTASASKIRTIIHEAFVGMVALNPLRQLMPTFIYVYALWNCGNLVENAGLAQSGSLCDTQGSRPLMVYEGIPNANSALKKMTDPLYNNSHSAVDVLLYLLQVVGAMEMAHAYADYTHYDLHSGNILIQVLNGPIHIWYLDYSIKCRERIVIIDNGLAHCKYERPSPIGLTKTAKYANAEGIQLFYPTSRSDPDAIDALDHLRTSRIINYGSTMNQALGVSRHRSYPLGDVFKIFFDLYSLCSSDIKIVLQPLVDHFFVDGSAASRMSSGASSSSSMFNEFSLPPFRDSLYNYRYRDFSEIILDTYGTTILEPYIVSRRSVMRPPPKWHQLPEPRLRDVMPEWRNVAVTNSTLFEIGIYASLDKKMTETMINRTDDANVPVIQDALSILEQSYRKLRETVVPKIIFVPLSALGGEPPSIETILQNPFFSRYSYNVDACTILVRSVRNTYSHILLAVRALDLLLLQKGDGDGEQMILRALALQDGDLDSLESFCRTIPLSSEVGRSIYKMKLITIEVEKIIRSTKIPKPITSQWGTVNWYRACLPGINSYLDFCDWWNGLSSSQEPIITDRASSSYVSMRELSLPSLKQSDGY